MQTEGRPQDRNIVQSRKVFVDYIEYTYAM